MPHTHCYCCIDIREFTIKCCGCEAYTKAWPPEAHAPIPPGTMFCSECHRVVVTLQAGRRQECVECGTREPVHGG